MQKTLSKTFLFIIIAMLFGCKINRMENHLREGLWVEKDTLDHIKYKSRGRYHKGLEVKTWRYFENQKLAKKEVYKDSICDVTMYYPNGKMRIQGQTKLRITDSLAHWFYFGDWREYDEKENLIFIKSYENGELVNELETVP